MQLHNILITDYPGISPAVQLSQEDSIIETAGNSITTCLTDFLSSANIPRGTAINLILDQAFVRYQNFNLPKISARRLRQILPFELDDNLLKGIENYLYTCVTATDKISETTTAGIYIIEKQLMDELHSIFRLFNLELRWVTSFENLLDLAYREASLSPENEVRIELDAKQLSARFFTYRNGFLSGISALPAASTAPADYQLFVEQINQRTNAIRLAEPGLENFFISGDLGEQVSVRNQQFIADASNPDNVENPDLNDPPVVRLDHPRRINLIRSNFLMTQELKKHSRSLFSLVALLLFSMVLYVGIVAYRAYTDNLTLQALDQRLSKTISRHLPANTPKSNAVYILKERIRNLEEERDKQQVFEQRRYQVAKALTDLSLLKEGVPSLTLNRFSLNGQAIRFHGKTASLTEFDRMREEISKLFPLGEFRINTNEKSLSNGSVEFSTTVQQKTINR